MSSNNRRDNEDPFGSTSPFGASGNDNPFGATGFNDNPFGASTVNDSPFGASGNDNPFGATSNNDNPFGAPADPFGASNAAAVDPFGASAAPSHVVPNPFGAAPAAAHVVPNPFGAAPPADPFAIGNDAGEAAAHVVPNPFGAFGGGGAAPADPFAIGNDADPPAHVIANPFGAFGGAAAAAPPAAAAANENPFAFGNAAGGGMFAGLGAAVANLAANPFGIANGGPVEDANLDLSQHSLGETFLSAHMTRIAQDTSMQLTEEERRWTQELKAAVDASEDVKSLTDMELAQQALTHNGHVLNALLSIKSMQEFRKMYGIDDTKEQGLQCLQALFDQQDAMFLEIDLNPQTQEASIVVDVREFCPRKATAIIEGKPADHSWTTLVRGYYYLSRVAQPSLASIRHGLFLVVDCDGVGWSNFDNELDQRLHAELLSHLPMNYKKTMCYGTAMVSNIWWGLTKRLWSEQFRNVLELGCKLVDTDPSRPPRRLATMYRQPDLETVRRKMERRAMELLQTRENNDEEFTLAPVSATS